MARFYGAIGFKLPGDNHNGVVKMEVIERPYHGTIIKNSNRYAQPGTAINQDVTLDMSVSIIADPYAFQNFFGITYVIFQGKAWHVTSVMIDRPRLELQIGGVYNGETVTDTTGA